MGPASTPLRLLAALALAWPAAARADVEAVDTAAPPGSASLSLQSSLAATDNADSAADGLAHADVLATLRPRAVVRHDSARLKLNVDAAADLLASARGYQPATGRLAADASVNAILVDDLLAFEGSAHAIPTEQDPFGPRPDSTSSSNLRTERRFHAQPSLRVRPAPNLMVEVLRDDSLTLDSAGSTRDSVAHATRLRVERQPVPVGVGVELSRFDGQAIHPNGERLVLETGRARLDWKSTPELQLDAQGGADRTITSLGRSSGAAYGVGMTWQPTPRTTATAALDHRFFGNGGELHLSHRNPSTSIEIVMSRSPSLVSQALDTATGPRPLQAALDAILTTRHPDAAVRRVLVDKTMAQQGLANLDVDPVDVAAPYPQMLTRAGVAATWSAGRTTVSVEAHSQTTRQLRNGAGGAVSPDAVGSDSRQTGASLQFARRLDPRMSVALLVERARIAGLADLSSQESTQNRGRLWLTRTLDARSSATFGIQYDRFTTSVASQHGFHAAVAFVGLNQSF